MPSKEAMPWIKCLGASLEETATAMIRVYLDSLLTKVLDNPKAKLFDHEL